MAGDGACRTSATTDTVGNTNPTTAPAINTEYSSVTTEASVTTTEDSSVTTDGPDEARQRRHGGLAEYTGPLSRRQREITHVMRVEVAHDKEATAVDTPAEKKPVQLMTEHVPPSVKNVHTDGDTREKRVSSNTAMEYW
ncbi:hypothetical protein PF002_g25788 [Phytophthora fragariae]|uniref:Uncharacterized protein n=1 Tax=Phytophthora fragariae TaxID=53985 RepID=A0A6A3WS61_9STRA|nr:hypothetical protein PF003_g20397 [Phytophthora fragariae]KAE9186745.1 hypothetical protein PF002_g25788 [Phytophthora fragariae]